MDALLSYGILAHYRASRKVNKIRGDDLEAFDPEKLVFDGLAAGA